MSDENPYASFGQPSAPAPASVDAGTTDRSWLVLLHLSQFCGYLVPFGGFVVPIAIWLLMKQNSPEIDAHGKIVANWIVSEIAYTVICIVLFVTVIGIPVVMIAGPILAILGVVFPIVGAVKASNGVAWRYPLSIGIF